MQLYRLLRIVMLLLIPSLGLSSCFGLDFYQASPIETAAILTLPTEIRFGGESITTNEAHLLTSSASWDWEGASSPIQTLCIKEGSDCSACTDYQLGGTPFEFSRPSGQKQISILGKDGNGATSSCVTFTVRVSHLNAPPEPQVADHGHFHDRVKKDASGACSTLTEALGNECMPGALLLKWNSGFASCDSLSLSDNGNDFDWKCTMENGNAVFYGDYGYDGETKPISGLIDSAKVAFRPKELTLTHGTVTYNHVTDPWWTDAIQEAPHTVTGEVSLSSTNTIYLITNKVDDPDNSDFKGYVINADGISLIGDTSFTLTASPTTPVTFNGHLRPGLNLTNERAMIFVKNAERTLIETPKLDAGGNVDIGVAVANSSLTWIGSAQVKRALEAGIALQSDSLTSLQSATIQGGGINGIDAYSSQNLYLSNVKIFATDNGTLIRESRKFGLLDYIAANSTVGTGLLIYGTNIGNSSSPIATRTGAIANVRISNFPNAIEINESENVTIAGMLINDVANGILIDSGENHRILQGTIVRLTGTGIRLHSSINNQPAGTYFGNLVIASLPTAIDIANNTTGARESLFSDMIFGPIANTGHIVSAPGANTHLKFYDQFIFDPTNVNCTIGSATPASNIETGCTTPNFDSRRLVSWSSTSLGSGFVGKPGTKDFDNTTSNRIVAGTTPMSFPDFNRAHYNDVTDWFNFANKARTWGQQTVDAIPGFTFDGTTLHCSGVGDICEIFDFGLNTFNVANILRRRTANNTAGNPVENPKTPSTSRDFPHTAPIGTESSIACPSHLRDFHGGVAHKWTPPQLHPDITPAPILRYTIEKLLDGLGNENGLCEAGEECIYTPNFGYFQGNGMGFGPCDQSGDVSYDPTNDEFLVFGHGKDGYN